LYPICSGYGTDITDASANVFDHYTTMSVSGCASSSDAYKFYSSNKNLSLDCLLVGNCPVDYFYVDENGLDYEFCGTELSPCNSVV
jgi:hypothetical protein